MQKISTILMTVISIAIAFVIFPIIIDSTHDLQTDTKTQVINSVTSADGTATLTLQYDVYDDDVDSVVSITSTVASDTVLVTDVDGKSVSVSGLKTGESRNLTVKYDTPALTQYQGLQQIVNITPFLVFIIIFLGLVGGGYAIFKNRQ